jgi:hypothetical protein
MCDFIFILYSCKKNLENTNKIYDKIYNKLLNTKVYIIYGDDIFNNDDKYKIIDDKYIVLNVKDDYEHLCDKTLLLIQVINICFPSIKGLFKCDDDIIINLKHINIIKNIIITENNIDYCGKKIVITKEYANKFNQNNLYPNYESIYCGGPLYFLSKKSMEYFTSSNEIKIMYYEDILVGYNLNKNNIFPNEKFNLYSDDIRDSPNISFHNRNHFNELYVMIQGGLGNQLFQLAYGIKMAEKYNKKLMLNENTIIPNYHQNNDINITLDTIKTIFPNISICKNKLLIQEFYLFKEEKNDCFLCIENKLEKCFDIYNNVVLQGYFINYKYIPKNIFENINITPKDINLLNFDFKDVYFIHIRLGDYLKNKMYLINLKSYYNYWINKILSLNNKAIFYICTNQYDDHLQNYIKDFPKNMKYKIQDRTHNDSDTLYIMSSCCGAICANSTLSFMGSVLQKTKKNKENIYMPYPFVNFTDGFNETNVTREMYPDWCTIYNTLNDKIMI